MYLFIIINKNIIDNQLWKILKIWIIKLNNGWSLNLLKIIVSIITIIIIIWIIIKLIFIELNKINIIKLFELKIKLS